MSLSALSALRAPPAAAARLARRLCSGFEYRRLPQRIGDVRSLPAAPELGPDGDSTRVLVRAADLTLQSCVLGSGSTSEDANGEEEPLLLLTGGRGCGKSMSLRAAVASARAAGCVALYVPRATEWTHGGGFFSAAESEDGPRWYERPGQTRAALEAMLEMHSDDLARVPCAHEAASDLREAAERGVQLVRDADDDWRMNPVRAGEMFSAVVEGLAAEQDLRFVVAIDEFDAFVGLSALGNNRGRVVHSCAISSVGRHFGRDAIMQFAGRMRNGVVVLAQSGYHPRQKLRASRVLGTTEFPVSEQVRRDPSGSKWLEEMWETEGEGKSFVEFERFSRKEMEDVLKLQQVELDDVDPEALERLMLLSGGRADVLSKMSASL